MVLRSDDCPPGWAPVGGEGARDLEQELASEVAPDHPLHGRTFRALAQHYASDAALFEIDDGSFAIVHLWWTGAVDPGGGPPVEILASLADWRAMEPDSATDFTDEIDLHAFSPEDASALVTDFLDHWQQRGPRDVRIIHGKGTGAMQRLVHAILARHPAVLRFTLASDSSGWGATVATIRPGAPPE